jgi:hypothetical protein
MLVPSPPRRESLKRQLPYLLLLVLVEHAEVPSSRQHELSNIRATVMCFRRLEKRSGGAEGLEPATFHVTVHYKKEH